MLLPNANRNARALCPFLERECPEGEQIATLCSVYFSTGSDPMEEPMEMWTTCALARRMFFGDLFPPASAGPDLV